MIRFVAAWIDNETTGAVPFVTFCANRLPNPSYVQLRPHSGPVAAEGFLPRFGGLPPPYDGPEFECSVVDILTLLAASPYPRESWGGGLI